MSSAPPLVVYPGWEESFRERKMAAVAHRIKHQREIFEHKECTEYEAMLYVSSASLVAPPDYNWVQIYLWLFQHYRPDVAEANDLKPDRPELNVNQREDLTRLRQWIFRRQVEHMRGKMKGEQPQTKPAAEKAEIEVVQERML